jgi:non-specific serine/threonine protein kinase
MLKALFYCHKVVKVIHRDIKPDNIMINHNQEAVLIDFGVSFIMIKDTEKDPATANIQGSKLYFAPELLYDNEERNKIQINGE